MSRELQAGPDVVALGLKFFSLPPDQDQLVVETIVPGSWAAKHSICEKDTILSLNGQSTAGMTLNEFKKVIAQRPLKLRIRLTAKRRAFVLAKSAVAGSIALGSVGGAVGSTLGGFIGASIGTFSAPFTLGLSIPVGMALGSGTGLCAGCTMGGTAGLTAGVLIGSAYSYHEELCSLVRRTAPKKLLVRTTDSNASGQARAG